LLILSGSGLSRLIQLALVFCPFIAFCLFGSNSLYAQAQTNVWLAFNVDAPKREVICLNQFQVASSYTNTNEQEHFPFTQQDIDHILTELPKFFKDAGIDSLNFSTEDNFTNITVYFQGYRECVFGEALPPPGDGPEGTDFFNANQTGEVVYMFAQSEQGYDNMPDLLRVLAHELAHTFGSAHILPTQVQNPLRDAIMDDRLDGSCTLNGCKDQFLSAPARLDGVSFLLHNPAYYMRRWVDRETQEDLAAEGLCPGNYDEKEMYYAAIYGFGFIESAKGLLKLISSGTGESTFTHAGTEQSATIYDIKLLVDVGHDALKVAQSWDQLPLDGVIEASLDLSLGAGFQLVAASQPGGEVDIALAETASSFDSLRSFSIPEQPRSLSLVQLLPDDSVIEVPGISVKILPNKILRDGFEGQAATNSNPASTGLVAEEAPACGAEFLQVLKAGSGRGTVVSEPAAINCGPDCDNGIGAFGLGSVVKLTATPEAASNSKFQHWSGVEACEGSSDPVCYVPMSQSQEITARFDLDYTFSFVWPDSPTELLSESESYGPGDTVTIANGMSHFVALKLDGQLVVTFPPSYVYTTFDFVGTGVPYGPDDALELMDYIVRLTDHTNSRDVEIPVKLRISNAGYRNIAGRSITMANFNPQRILTFHPFADGDQFGVLTTQSGETVVEGTWSILGGRAESVYKCPTGENILLNKDATVDSPNFTSSDWFSGPGHIWISPLGHFCPGAEEQRIVLGDH